MSLLSSITNGEAGSAVRTVLNSVIALLNGAGTAGTTLTGTETIPSVQSNSNVDITTAQIKTFTSASPSLVTPALGTPASGNLANCTFPTLNQNTSGSAATATLAAAAAVLATPRAIYGNNFDGSAALTQIIASTYGGTGNGFAKIVGPAGSEKQITVPNANVALAALDIASQTLSGGALVTVFDNGTKSSGTFTIVCGNCPLQKCVNGGAFTLAAPAADSSCMLMVTNNGSAGAITFSGFSVGSNTGDALTTTNTQVFTISIWRINGVSGYRIAAHQ